MKNNVIEYWNDKEIMPGHMWDEELKKNLHDSDIIIFLLSPDFLASHYIYENELRIAFEKHNKGEIIIVPVMLRMCIIEDELFNGIQGLPRDLVPIDSKKWPSKDWYWVEVMQGLRIKINEVKDIKEKRRNAQLVQLDQKRLKKEEKDRAEAELIKNEKIENDRKEKERLEKERLENERLEKVRLEKERLEKERVEKERVEKERVEKERVETERVEKERVEKERVDKESIEKERQEKEQKAKVEIENTRKAIQEKEDLFKREFDKAYKFYNDGQFSNAYSGFSSALALKPNDQKTRQYLGYTKDQLDRERLEKELHAGTSIEKSNTNNINSYSLVFLAIVVLAGISYLIYTHNNQIIINQQYPKSDTGGYSAATAVAPSIQEYANADTATAPAPKADTLSAPPTKKDDNKKNIPFETTSPEYVTNKDFNNYTYTGYINKYGLPNGKGEKKFKSNKSRYIGNFVNGLFEGKGVYYLSSGDKYDGNFKHDNYNGQGEYYYSNGDKYDGNRVDDIKSGHGIYYYSSGNKYDGNWVDGKKSGRGIFTYKNGDRSDGNWVDDHKNGHGIYYYIDGDRYDGNWVNDKMNGFGKYYYSVGGRYEGNWVDDVRNGDCKCYNIDGKLIFEGQYKDDKPVGK